MSINVAVLGAGRIGRIHAANIAAHPDLELAGVADMMPDVAKDVASRLGSAPLSVDAAIEDPAIRGIVVATNTDTHLDLTRRAHAAGKTVFCEKPVDMDLERARAAMSEFAGDRIFVGFNRRFDPSFASLKSKIVSGEVGALETLQITSNDPAPPPAQYVATSGGIFVDMTIHDFDMARHLLGDEPTEVFAWGSCLVDPAIGAAGDVDTARVLIRTGSGKLCVIANSRRSGFGYDQRIEAFCSSGMIAAANVTATTVEVWGEGGRAFAPFQNFFLDRYASAFVAEMAHFADVLAGRSRPMVTFADGVAALALAQAAQTSLETGSPVSL